MIRRPCLKGYRDLKTREYEVQITWSIDAKTDAHPAAVFDILTGLNPTCAEVREVLRDDD